MRLRVPATLLAATLVLLAPSVPSAEAGPPRVDSTVISEPGAVGHEPVVAALPGGGAVIVWKAFRRPEGRSEVQARFAGPDETLGAIVHVGTLRGSATNNRGPAEVAPLPDGRVAVGWYGRVAYVDPELGVTAVVESAAGDDDMRIAAAPDGSIGAVFEETVQLGDGSYYRELRYRRIDPAGTLDPVVKLGSAAYFDWSIAIADDGWTTVGWIESDASAFRTQPVSFAVAPDGTPGTPVPYGGPGATYVASLSRRPGGGVIAAASRTPKPSAPARADLIRFAAGVPSAPRQLNRSGHVEALTLGRAPLGSATTAAAWRRVSGEGDRTTQARVISAHRVGGVLPVATGAKVEELSIGAGSTPVATWRGREQRLLAAPVGRVRTLPEKVRLGHGFRPSTATDTDATVAYAAWAGKPVERGTRREPIRFATVR